MPNRFILTVEDPDDILNAGMYGTGAVIRLQTATTEAGIYADVSGTGSTPTSAVVAATRSYDAYDPNGIASSWYRTRYENAGATRTSDWTDPFQAGDETGGLLCSVEDVEQELASGTLSDNERESVLDKIREVTTAVEGYCNRWFVPRPASGDATYRTHTKYGRKLSVPKGIRSITTLGIATSDQPATGGTYTTVTASAYYIDPPTMERTTGWPGLSICMTNTGGAAFYQASFGVEITGTFGWSAVPPDIQGVAVRASIRRYLGKSGGGVSIAVGPEGTEFMLPDLSGTDRTTLDKYKELI